MQLLVYISKHFINLFFEPAIALEYILSEFFLIILLQVL
jgi:hypothetical protein